jgi:hypothetical protein
VPSGAVHDRGTTLVMPNALPSVHPQELSMTDALPERMAAEKFDALSEMIDAKLKKKFDEISEMMDGKLKKFDAASEKIDAKLKKFDVVSEMIDAKLKKFDVVSEMIEDKLEKKFDVVSEMISAKLKKYDGVFEMISVRPKMIEATSKQVDAGTKQPGEQDVDTEAMELLMVLTTMDLESNKECKMLGRS